jgi:hypothetical protein
VTSLFESKAYPKNPAQPPGAPDGYLSPSQPSDNPWVRQPPQSSSKVNANRNLLQELISKHVLMQAQGFVGPGSFSDQLKAWFADHEAQRQETMNAIQASLENVWLIGDLIEVLRQQPDSDPNDLGSWFNARVNDVRETILNLVNGFTGATAVNWQHPDVFSSVQNTAQTIADMSNAITQLQNQQTANGIAGNSAVVDFTKSAYNQFSLGSMFTQNYTSGSGSSTWGVLTHGVAEWYVNFDGNRSCQARYNALQTLSDYQLIGVAFVSSPEWFNSSVMAYNYIQGRMNSTGTDYVYVKFQRYGVEIGCVVGGVVTVWDSAIHNFKANTAYWLECGNSVSGSRIFRVREGNNVIMLYTEVGTTSQMDASHRYVGTASDLVASGVGAQHPATMSAFSFSDNVAPSTIGSTGTMLRLATGGAAASSGMHPWPTSFFDTQGKTSSDIIPNLTNGTFQVTYAGQYNISFHCDWGADLAATTDFLLYINGNPDHYIGSTLSRGVGPAGGNQNPTGFGYSGSIQLAASDVIGLGYEASTGTVGNFFSGDPNGRATWYTISLESRSVA